MKSDPWGGINGVLLLNPHMYCSIKYQTRVVSLREVGVGRGYFLLFVSIMLRTKFCRAFVIKHMYFKMYWSYFPFLFKE